MILLVSPPTTYSQLCPSVVQVFEGQTELKSLYNQNLCMWCQLRKRMHCRMRPKDSGQNHKKNVTISYLISHPFEMTVSHDVDNIHPRKPVSLPSSSPFPCVKTMSFRIQVAVRLPGKRTAPERRFNAEGIASIHHCQDRGRGQWLVSTHQPDYI